MPTLERSCCFEHKIGGHGYDYMITIIRATPARALIHPCIYASVHPRSLFLPCSLYRFNSWVDGVRRAAARACAGVCSALPRSAHQRPKARARGTRAKSAPVARRPKTRARMARTRPQKSARCMHEQACMHRERNRGVLARGRHSQGFASRATSSTPSRRASVLIPCVS